MTVTLNAEEVRTFAALELRAQPNAAGRYTELAGRAVPYGEWSNVGWYAERFARGAFDKSIGEAARALPLLMWHDNQTWPIGAATDWSSHVGGLDGKWELDDSEEAQRAAQLADKGYLTGMSVGFVPMRSAWDYVADEEWNPDLGVEHIDKVTREEGRLVEVSLTPTPAYAGAAVGLVRSLDGRGRRARPDRVAREIAAWRDYLDRVRAV